MIITSDLQSFRASSLYSQKHWRCATEIESVNNTIIVFYMTFRTAYGNQYDLSSVTFT